MRFRYLLPAVLLTAGSAMAQAGAATPNAVGVWSSRAFGFVGWFIGTGYPAGQGGNTMWQALPPELTTYFRSNTGANPNTRELDFRGVEMTVTHFNSFILAYDGPRIQVSAAKPNPAQTQRWIPDNTVVGSPYVDIASTPGLVVGGSPAGTVYKLAFNIPAVRIPTVTPGGTGNAIMLVWQDYMKTLGDGNDLYVVSTSTEPGAGGIQSVSYSGGSIVSGQNFIVPNGFPTATSSCEYCFTWLFEQSMIQMVKNAKIISQTGQILGGGPPPAPFTVDYDDGRGAVYPNPGEAVSYNGNSTYGNPQPDGNFSSTWFAPFVLFSGDVPVASPTDPTPETWDTGGNNYIYRQDVRDWIDDFCAITGACPPGTGAIINPSGSNWGIWMGIDLPNFVNITVLLNGIAFADINSIQWSGPISMAYDNPANLLGLLGRNLANVAGYLAANATPILGIKEHRTLLVGPQSGYTPVGGGADLNGNGSQLGFGVNPGGLGGNTFAVQCWMIDLAITQVVDVTNVAEARLQ